MADDGYDFFAPQPKPVPRAKNTMFDVVPDAFSGKTLEFTGDHRRQKQPSGSSGAGTKAGGTPSSEGQAPVQETIVRDVAEDVEAERWEGVRVCTDRFFSKMLLTEIGCEFS